MDDAVVPLSLSSPDIFLSVDFELGLLVDSREAALFLIPPDELGQLNEF
jgi:hypothetical protein